MPTVLLFSFEYDASNYPYFRLLAPLPVPYALLQHHAHPPICKIYKRQVSFHVFIESHDLPVFQVLVESRIEKGVRDKGGYSKHTHIQ